MAAAALLAVYYMFEYWPVTLAIVILMPIVVVIARFNKKLPQ